MFAKTDYIIAFVAIFASTITAQSISANGTVETNNNSNSALISFGIIGNSTIDPAIRKAVNQLINATVNGTDAVRKAIADAAKEFLNNGNLTANAIISFIQAARRNINALGNGTAAGIARDLDVLQKFVENNRQVIQQNIDNVVKYFRDAIKSITSAINGTIANLINLISRPLPTIPLPTLPTLPSFFANIGFGFGR